MNPAITELTQRSSHFQPPLQRASRPRYRKWSLSVLVVDDDEADVSLILNVLKRHPNVAAAYATESPAFALRQIADNHLRPNLLLLDIHMPRIDGFRFLESLRLIPAMSHVPVVFLTTSSLIQDVAEARHSSAASYVVKPDTFVELQSSLNGVIRRAASGAWGG